MKPEELWRSLALRLKPDITSSRFSHAECTKDRNCSIAKENHLCRVTRDVTSPRSPYDLFAESLFQIYKYPSTVKKVEILKSQELTSQDSELSSLESGQKLSWPHVCQTKTDQECLSEVNTSPLPTPSMMMLIDNRSFNSISLQSIRMINRRWTTESLTHSRSRAIPIQRRPAASTHFLHMQRNDGSSPSSDDDTEVEYHYDWTTWQLYHRIVEHRKKYPLTPSYYENVENALNVSTCGTSRALHLVKVPFHGATMVDLTKLSPFDGEMFELEL